MCVCMHMYVYEYMCAYGCVCIYIYMCIYMHIYMRVCISIRSPRVGVAGSCERPTVLENKLQFFWKSSKFF